MDKMLPSVGHNSGDVPLAELLAEKTAALKQRADDLVGSASRAKIKSQEDAEKAATLVKMITVHTKAIEDERTARKAPYLEAGRTVDSFFGAITGPLDMAKTVVMIALDTYRRKVEDEARAERLRAEAAARAAQEEADRLEAERQRLAAKPLPGAAVLDAEIAAAAAQDRAAQAAQAAARIEAAPIQSGVATASKRTTYRAEITDIKAALKHAAKVDARAILAAVQAIYDRQVRAGVRDLPGAAVHAETSTVVR
jgi:hypothetical protein